MKACIVLVTHNKEKSIPNTLTSIAMQKTSFPLDVCILDDHSDVDPEPLIRQYLPNVIYRRLEKNVGYLKSKDECLKLVPPDADVIILQQIDVIMTDPHAVERLCKGVDKKRIALAEVVDIPVSEDIYKNFNESVSGILNKWQSYLLPYTGEIDDTKYTLHPKYTGPDYECAACAKIHSCSWLFFLGAIRRKDLDLLDYGVCDVSFRAQMKALKFTANLLGNVKGIHQRHPKVVYPCSIIDTCKLNCIRKKG